MWTYSNKSHKWVNDSFATKEEAILHGAANHDQFYVGQLIEHSHLQFVLDNIEKVIQ